MLRAGAAALLPMAAGPWLARLPLELLDRLAEPRPRPLSTRFGRQRYRAGFIARRSAEDLAPFRALRARPAMPDAVWPSLDYVLDMVLEPI